MLLLTDTDFSFTSLVSQFRNGSVFNDLALVIDALANHISQSENVKAELEWNTSLAVVECFCRLDE